MAALLREDCALERIASVLGEMERHKCIASPSTYAAVLHRCASEGALEQGRQIHEHLNKFPGLRQDRYLANCLSDMYGKCRSLKEARSVFDRIFDKNVYSWTIIIRAYADCEGYEAESLKMLRYMDQEGVEPNSATFVTILIACSGLGGLSEVTAVHKRLSTVGLDTQVLVGTALVNAYGKCGSIIHASSAFERIEAKNAISWTTVITACAQNGHPRGAVNLYKRMLLEGIIPDRVTFTSLLDACARVRYTDHWFVGNICESGLETSMTVAPALLNMYGKNGKAEDAVSFFEMLPMRNNVVVWNVMITIFGLEGHIREALWYYRRMNLEGVKPDRTTFTSVVNACTCVEALSEGRVVHGNVIASGMEVDDVLRTVILNMYGRCGCVEEARAALDEIQEPSVVPWSALVSAYATQGLSKDAMLTFQRMELEGVKPNEYTLVAVLGACGKLGIAHARSVHKRVRAEGYDSHQFVVNTLMSMYTSCGSIVDTKDVFDKTEPVMKSLVTWNCMIEAYAQHGHSQEALDVYQVMEIEGVKPNAVTLVSVLAACSHVGRVERGLEYYAVFCEDYGVSPEVEHCGCLVDMLGRAGWLQMAEQLIESLPARDEAAYWAVLLSACKTHGDVERGTRSAQKAIGVHRDDAGSYVTISNLCRLPNNKEAAHVIYV